MQLERGLKIVDSPGVVIDEDDFDDGKSRQRGNILLRNVVKVEDIEDPVAIGTLYSVSIPIYHFLTLL